MNLRAVSVVVALGVLTVAVVAGVGSVLLPGSTPELDSELAQQAREHGVSVQTTVSGPLGMQTQSTLAPDKTVYVLMDPQRPFDGHEQDGFHEFLLAGGKAIVFDGFGTSGDLSQRYGLAVERVRLTGPGAEQIEAFVDGTPWDVALTNPSAIRITQDSEARVTGMSGSDSFLDLDGDGVVSHGEPEGTFPVIAEVDVGAAGGLLVLVADAALGDAASQPPSETHAWRNAVLNVLLPDGGTVVLDTSQAEAGTTAAVIGWMVRTSQSGMGEAMLLVAGALALGSLFMPVVVQGWRTHRFRPDRFVRRADVVQDQGPPKDPGPATAATEGWTPRGVAALSVGLVLLSGGLVWGNHEATLAAALIAVALVSSTMVQRVKIRGERRLGSREVPEGASVPVALHLDVRSRSTAQVMDTLQDDFELVEGSPFSDRGMAKGRRVMEYVVAPAVSGPHKIGPLLARTGDPLHLRFRQETLLPADRLRVVPRDQGISKLPHHTRAPSLIMGLHMVNKAGDGTEFHALREYQNGDSLRTVNWKASARSKDLMVNQRVHESMAEVTILVDARAVTGAGPIATTPVAQARRVVIALVSAAIRVRDKVRVVAYGNTVEHAPVAPGMEQIHHMNRFLSELGAEGATPLQDAVESLLVDLKPGRPVILVTGMESDPTVLDAVKVLRSRDVNPVLIALALGVEPVGSESGDAEPGAPRILQERQQMVSALHAVGVQVYDWDGRTPLDHLFKMGGIV